MMLAIFLAPAAVGLILFVAAFLANIRDQPLLPQASSALAARHADVPPDGNLSFEAGADRDKALLPWRL